VNTFWGCNTPEVAAIIRERSFSAFIVHGWSTFSFWQAMTACWRTATPLLVRGDSRLATPRPRWWRAFKAPVFRTFVPRFDAYLVVGRLTREYLLHYGADPARCFAAPHSVDNRFFAEASERLREQRRTLREHMGLSPAATVFLFVGRLIQGKDVDVFIDAIGDAAKTDAVAGLIVGDGPLRVEAEARARRKGAPVRFAGFLNQRAMAGAYAASDVLVVPSRSETWGLVVNEAMACGLPAVVSDGVGCAPDLVIPGSTGERFGIGDVETLSGHMTHLAADAVYRERLGGQAKAHVAEYDVSATVKGTLQAIQAVAA
jgi:glycosyltransferase involved in cell wall biosynthesis